MHVELPDGQSAELRERPLVGGRIAIQSAAAQLGHALEAAAVNGEDYSDLKEVPRSLITGDVTYALWKLNCSTIVALLVSWTLPNPIPKSTEEWEETDLQEVYDALQDVVAPKALMAGSGPQLSAQAAVDPDTGVLDPDSPTSASSNSDAGGEEAPTLTTDPTPTSSFDFAPTSIEDSSLAPVPSSS